MAKKNQPRRRGYVQLTGSNYQNPLLQETLRLLAKSNLTITAQANRSGVCQGTYHRWMKKPGCNPLSSTLRFALRAIGHDLKVVPLGHMPKIVRDDK